MTNIATGVAGLIGSSFVLDWFRHHEETIVNLGKLAYVENFEGLALLDGNARRQFVRSDIDIGVSTLGQTGKYSSTASDGEAI